MPGAPLVWVMLNPSTADANIDDPTIRRVINFTKAAGHPAAVVLNLYALRATDPVELDRHPDPIGPENGYYLDVYATGPGVVVCAWGARPVARARAFDVMHSHLESADLVSLGTTKAGAPRHPLYVPAATPLTHFGPTSAGASVDTTAGGSRDIKTHR
jgi:hypothetical protein